MTIDYGTTYPNQVCFVGEDKCLEAVCEVLYLNERFPMCAFHMDIAAKADSMYEVFYPGMTSKREVV